MNSRKSTKTKRRLGLCIILTLALAVNGVFVNGAYADQYAASIGTQNYQTLAEAFLAVEDGETILLLGDVATGSQVESGIIDKAGIKFNLNLGGRTLSGDSPSGVLQLKGGQVTLYNGHIINNQGGPAVGSLDGNGTYVFPTGYNPGDLSASQLTIPAAYRVDLSTTGRGTVHYGSSTGPLVPTETGALFAGGMGHHFYFVPNTGHVVGSITVNGVSVPASGKYDISNLTSDQVINVGFKIIKFTIKPQAFTGDAPADQGVVVTPSSATVSYGGSQTFDITVQPGYKLTDVVVDGVSKGPVTSLTLTNVTKASTIIIHLQKTAFFIMLDAGHYEYYNHSPVVATYYEGNAMWILHQYLKQELTKYPGIIVDTTRPNNSSTIGSALDPYERGAMGKGYDLVLSLHSNACSSISPNYAVGIYTLNSKLTAVSRGLALKLVSTVSDVMDISQIPSVYTKAQSDGRDWYGVNRGAADVGVPSVILEHSFHTNIKSALWLLDDGNLQALAAAEAKTIANYYGINKNGTMIAPKTPATFTAYGSAYNQAKVVWSAASGASGYQVYRATTPDGSYTRVKTTTLTSFTNTDLSCGKPYYYKVRAYRTTWEGTKYSTFTAVDTAKPVPARPGVNVYAYIQKAQLKWTSVSGAHGYFIYRQTGTTGTQVKVKTITSKDVLQWTNKGLTTGKTYTYQVRAYRIVNGKTVLGRLSTPDTVKIK